MFVLSKMEPGVDCAGQVQADGSIVIEDDTVVLSMAVMRGRQRVPVYLALSCQSLRKLLGKVDVVLHVREKNYFDTLIADARRHSFMLGRYVAKLALLRSDAHICNGSRLSDIEIAFGVFKQPVVRRDTGNSIQVSISHSQDWGAALAFPEEHPMAIDVEQVDKSNRLPSLMSLSADERNLLDGAPLSELESYTLVWTIKEALSKVLKIGLTVDFTVLAISKLRHQGRYMECLFTNFPQYRAVSWRFHGMAWSIVLPKNSEFDVNALLAGQCGHFGVY